MTPVPHLPHYPNRLLRIIRQTTNMGEYNRPCYILYPGWVSTKHRLVVYRVLPPRRQLPDGLLTSTATTTPPPLTQERRHTLHREEYRLPCYNQLLRGAPAKNRIVLSRPIESRVKPHLLGEYPENLHEGQPANHPAVQRLAQPPIREHRHCYLRDPFSASPPTHLYPRQNSALARAANPPCRPCHPTTQSYRASSRPVFRSHIAELRCCMPLHKVSLFLSLLFSPFTQYLGYHGG